MNSINIRDLRRLASATMLSHNVPCIITIDGKPMYQIVALTDKQNVAQPIVATVALSEIYVDDKEDVKNKALAESHALPVFSENEVRMRCCSKCGTEWPGKPGDKCPKCRE